MDAKEYYQKEKRSDWYMNTMRSELLRRIMGDLKVKSVFEFGCGRGENLEILQSVGIQVYGVDINSDEVSLAELKLGTITAEITCGDENRINDYVKDAFEVSFTCGVLDHVEELHFYDTLSALEKVTKGKLYCLETNDIPKDSVHYYPHDYLAAGFYPKGVFLSEGNCTDGTTYTLWVKSC